MKTFGSALLSYGHSGKVFHAPFLAEHPGYRFLGSWERSKSMVQSDFASTRSYGSLDEILNDPAIDLVVVNTPTYTHFDYASRALGAGKHVVVEKAFTTTVEEAESLEAIAKRAGRLVAVYQNRRWDRDFVAVRDVVSAGELGNIVEAQFSFERYNPGLSPKTHKEEPGPGAGNLMDLGPHLIDQALVLFGMPQEVYADLRVCRPDSKVDDYFELLLYYPDLRVRLRSTYFAANPGPAYLIHGRKGTASMPRLDIQEAQLKQGMKPSDPAYAIVVAGETGTLTLAGKGDTQVSRLVPSSGNYMEFYNQLFDALAGKGTVPVTGLEGINVMRVLAASQKSSRQGKRVSL